jgi:cyclase
MLTKRIVPSLLLKGGRLVKGTRFEAYRDAGNPATTARAHNAQGADEIFLADVMASKLGTSPDYEAIRVVARECYMPLTVGGGISSIDIAHRIFESGADKVCMTTTALDRPGLLTELSRLFGDQAVVLGVDVTGGPGNRQLFDHRTGRPVAGRDWIGWMREAVGRGAGEIRLMAVDREGARAGMDLDLLHEAMAAVEVPIVFEGGADSLDHLDEALAAGADALAIGAMLVFSDNNIMKVKRFLAGRSHAMRI